MNYEEFNKGCFEEAKRLYKTANANQRCVLEKLFPELKESEESEDEKIRKQIINAIHDYGKRLEEKIPTEWLAWLGKQCQVKEPHISQHENKTCEENVNSLTYEDEKVRKAIMALIEWSKSYSASGITNDDAKKMLAWLERQGGKHPDPYNGISFEYNGHIWGMCARDNGVDISCNKHLIKHLEEQGEKLPVGFYYVNSEGKKFYSDTFKYGNVILHVEKQGEQKSADKVEPKFHKGRVQPKQEWSEEDSYYRNHIIQIIEEINNAPLKRGEDWEAYINWLKSLRPQNKWKPSEDDIIILEKLINGELEPKVFQATLQGILEQLKKLKEGKV